MSASLFDYDLRAQRHSRWLEVGELAHLASRETLSAESRAQAAADFYRCRHEIKEITRAVHWKPSRVLRDPAVIAALLGEALADIHRERGITAELLRRVPAAPHNLEQARQLVNKLGRPNRDQRNGRRVLQLVLAGWPVSHKALAEVLQCSPRTVDRLLESPKEASVVDISTRRHIAAIAADVATIKDDVASIKDRLREKEPTNDEIAEEVEAFIADALASSA